MFFYVPCYGQSYNNTPYHYKDLSKVYYPKLIDSLIKANPCPELYAEKATQKKFKEYWDYRTDLIIKNINNNQYVHVIAIDSFLGDILNQLCTNNKTLIQRKPVLLIDRSSSPNAYSCGIDFIAVNIGIINYVKTREELAFIIAHELSHNILLHQDRSIKEKAEFITSEEYEQSLEQIRKEKYEKLTKLKKLFQTYDFGSKRHTRYSESSADSLAVILVKNSSLPFDARWLLRLDSTDIYYKKSLQSPIPDYFNTYQLKVDENWLTQRNRGLSTRSYNFLDTTGIVDSLKTHPDCKARYAATLSQSSPNPILTPIPGVLNETVEKILIWNLFDDKALSTCLYRVMLQKDAGNKDPWYDFMAHNVFFGLLYSSKQYNRFKAIGVIPKSYISKSYYELQNMLEQMPQDDIENYFKGIGKASFWEQLDKEERGLKLLMLDIDTNLPNYKEISTYAKGYIEKYPTSWYIEFADHFNTK